MIIYSPPNYIQPRTEVVAGGGVAGGDVFLEGSAQSWLFTLRPAQCERKGMPLMPVTLFRIPSRLRRIDYKQDPEDLLINVIL
jgi:hypothetical protein